MARLAAGMRVGALLRRVHAEGGSAMVLARGDEQAGAILVIALNRGEDPQLFEAGIGPGGLPALIASGPKDDATETDVTDYWKRRRSRDPDLWVIELDIPAAERFAAETIL